MNAILLVALSSVWLHAELLQQSPTEDEIPLVVGRSVVLDHPDDILRIALTDEEVADAIVVSPREVLVNAKSPGVTTLIVWSRSGDRSFFSISVGPNVQPLQEHIRAVFPGEPIRVFAIKGVITLSGSVSSRQVAERVLAMAKAFEEAGGSPRGSQ